MSDVHAAVRPAPRRPVPLVDGPVVDRLAPSLDHLEDAIGERCRDPTTGPAAIGSRTGFAWRSEDHAPA